MFRGFHMKPIHRLKCVIFLTSYLRLNHHTHTNMPKTQSSFSFYVTQKLSISSNEGRWKVWWVTGIWNTGQHCQAHPSLLHSSVSCCVLSLLLLPSPLLDWLSTLALPLSLAFTDFPSHTLSFFEFCCHRSHIEESKWARETVRGTLCACVCTVVV